MLFERFNYFLPDQIYFLITCLAELKCECSYLGFVTLLWAPFKYSPFLGVHRRMAKQTEAFVFLDLYSFLSTAPPPRVHVHPHRFWMCMEIPVELRRSVFLLFLSCHPSRFYNRVSNLSRLVDPATKTPPISTSPTWHMNYFLLVFFPMASAKWIGDFHAFKSCAVLKCHPSLVGSDFYRHKWVGFVLKLFS